jgi:hypothetical protein
MGEVLGISETAVAHLLRTGKLSSPRKVGGFWWCEPIVSVESEEPPDNSEGSACVRRDGGVV